jgi:hypothetical protein
MKGAFIQKLIGGSFDLRNSGTDEFSGPVAANA